MVVRLKISVNGQSYEEGSVVVLFLDANAFAPAYHELT